MFYWDMDGVLAVYNRDMFTKEEPKWDDLGVHCFRDVKRDEFAHNVLENLSSILSDEMNILTSVSNRSSDVTNEQIFDKMYWLSVNYKMISLCNFMCCVSGKNNIVSKIKGMNLSKSDILIDDWNKNLFAWQNAGGTAIKWLNGINSEESWPGPCVRGYSTYDVQQEVRSTVDDILKIWLKSTESI